MGTARIPVQISNEQSPSIQSLNSKVSRTQLLVPSTRLERISAWVLLVRPENRCSRIALFAVVAAASKSTFPIETFRDVSDQWYIFNFDSTVFLTSSISLVPIIAPKNKRSSSKDATCELRYEGINCGRQASHNGSLKVERTAQYMIQLSVRENLGQIVG
jgi:hypothetical protein